MRLMLSAAVIVTLSALCLATGANADTMKNCAAKWQGMSAADKGKTSYTAFSATCMKGGAAAAAPAPAAAPVAMKAAVKPVAATPVNASGAPAGATGQCKDGSFTTSKSHSGACSGHKGVAKWL